MRMPLKKLKDTATMAGFSLSELLVVISIIGILSAVAIPSYVSQLCRSDSAIAIATIGSIQSIMAAYADETGSLAENWDELNSLSAIMSSEGQATGSFEDPILLPGGIWEISINSSNNPTYNISAERTDGCPNRDIKACLDVSTGASDLKQGNGTTNAETPNCS